MSNKTPAAPVAPSHFSQTNLYEKHAVPTASKLAVAALSHLPLSTYTSESHILDSACGPGVVTQLLLAPSPPYISAPGLPLQASPRVTGIDITPKMIDLYQAHKQDLGLATADAFVRDATDLSCFSDNEFDAVVMNLGIFGPPDPIRAAAEMHRVLKPGGHAVVTTWKSAGSMVLLQKVVDAIRPDQGTAGPPMDPAWNTREKLVDVMRSGGFAADGMEVWAEDVRWEPESVDDVVEALTMMLSGSWGTWSSQEKARLRTEVLEQLSEEERNTLSISQVGWICIARKAV